VAVVVVVAVAVAVVGGGLDTIQMKQKRVAREQGTSISQEHQQ
jgi:hypothetical protein